jgi:multiple sugar transport system permease protein
MFAKKHNRLQAKENIAGYAFVTPALTCFILFMAFPFFLTLILSFFDFNFLKVKKLEHLAKYMKFCGFDNFIEMTKDRRFVQSIINTVVYTLATVPASIVLGLGLAYAMHGNIFCKKLLRLAFFIPYISSIVALGAVFKFLFREDGIINNVLLSLNIIPEAVKWSVDPAVSKIPIILLSIWSSLGYVMIIYMAAIENVPKSLYEAATIDGASSFTQFIKITVPLISPTTFYLVIVRMIAVFKIFSSVNVFTMGSSITSNTSIVQEIYSSAFTSYEHGYASAQSVVLLAIILIITAIQFWGQKKWVHY